MAARKLQQEVDKCFKKVEEGVQEFESIYDKIAGAANPAQKEKLEDNLKREIKKLQRLRDQIKTWAASNDIKDKGPLIEKRKLIETQMEKFKAVEKAMKTKAYSKEGLSATTKLDPKEQAKMDAFTFLSDMVEELERQIETLETEGVQIQASMKKGKSQSKLSDRVAEIDRITERHKWHQNRLELIKRSLENGVLETEQVTELEDSIKYYVAEGLNEEYNGEDETLYDDLNLQEEEDNYGMNNDNDRLSSQDTQSIQDEAPDQDIRSSSVSGKAKAAPEPPVAAARRPSTQMKSPLPALATLHTSSTGLTNGSGNQMKPAAVPTRAPGETLKYASAAAAAAASDKMGIAPLPPPPESLPPAATSLTHPPLPLQTATASPTILNSQPTSVSQTPVTRSSVPAAVPLAETPPSSQTKSPALSQSRAAPSGNGVVQPQNAERPDSTRPGPSRASSGKAPAITEPSENLKASVHTNGITNGVRPAPVEDPDESIYHLPSGLQDLLQSFEATQRRVTNPPSQSIQRMLAASVANAPDALDSLAPRTYKPKHPIRTPSYYPQELDPVFDDPRLYSRIDPDTLFYVFYYKQETYQQYLAAKALKDQSWRFHKQYQTWFQRHEEPKTITEEFEQGTYRFFDYESTWWGPYLTKIFDPFLVAPLYTRPSRAIKGIDRSEYPFELCPENETEDSHSSAQYAQLELHPQYLEMFGNL